MVFFSSGVFQETEVATKKSSPKENLPVLPLPRSSIVRLPNVRVRSHSPEAPLRPSENRKATSRPRDPLGVCRALQAHLGPIHPNQEGALLSLPLALPGRSHHGTHQSSAPAIGLHPRDSTPNSRPLQEIATHDLEAPRHVRPPLVELVSRNGTPEACHHQAPISPTPLPPSANLPLPGLEEECHLQTWPNSHLLECLDQAVALGIIARKNIQVQKFP